MVIESGFRPAQKSIEDYYVGIFEISILQGIGIGIDGMGITGNNILKKGQG